MESSGGEVIKLFACSSFYLLCGLNVIPKLKLTTAKYINKTHKNIQTDMDIKICPNHETYGPYLLINFDLKWCIHLSRSLIYFNYFVSVTAGGPVSP